MKINSHYPVLAVADPVGAAGFYRRHFGFETTFEAGWYVSLRTAGDPGFQLAFVASEHPSVPEGGRRQASGLLLNFEVDDVDAVYQSLIERGGLPVLSELRTEEWGQRHFITRDPSGVMIDVITLTAPSEEFLAQYAEDARSELPAD